MDFVSPHQFEHKLQRLQKNIEEKITQSEKLESQKQNLKYQLHALQKQLEHTIELNELMIRLSSLQKDKANVLRKIDTIRKKGYELEQQIQAHTTALNQAQDALATLGSSAKSSLQDLKTNWTSISTMNKMLHETQLMMNEDLTSLRDERSFDGPLTLREQEHFRNLRYLIDI